MHLLIAAAAAGTLLGCGQKGPLVLPDAQHPQKKVGLGKFPASPATSAPAKSAPSSGSTSGSAPPPAGPAPQPQPPSQTQPQQ
jgi:predicted small lipoprotein YifL